MAAKTVEVRDAETQLAELISLAEAGMEIILTEQSTPRARLVPFSQGAPRVAGLHAGAVWCSDDFDQPLPDVYWTGSK
jgi:antitoxin (DNA-binding transcriptional repressor) of toxin-antitoxin stability system